MAKRVQVYIEVDGRRIDVCQGEIDGASLWMFWHKIRPDGGVLHLPPIFRVERLKVQHDKRCDRDLCHPACPIGRRRREDDVDTQRRAAR